MPRESVGRAVKVRGGAVLIKALGALYLVVGVGSALLGPIELYVFYLFSEGGRFHYDGFRFGSFLFGFIAIQIVGYYMIGAILVPLGIGHLRLRRWSSQLAQALLWCWLALGVPVLLAVLATVVSFKELSTVALGLLVVALAASYPLVPLLLRRMYRSRGVKVAFCRGRSTPPTWIDRLSVVELALTVLLLFFGVVLHFPILLNGVCPVFGRWLTGLPGIVALTAAIVMCWFCAWAVAARLRWASAGAVVLLSLLTISVVLSFSVTCYDKLLDLLSLPPAEVDMLDGIPARGPLLAAFFGLPLAGGGVVGIAACFGSRSRSSRSGRTD